jgi:hypothetical protein
LDVGDEPLLNAAGTEPDTLALRLPCFLRGAAMAFLTLDNCRTGSDGELASADLVGTDGPQQRRMATMKPVSQKPHWSLARRPTPAGPGAIAPRQPSIVVTSALHRADSALIIGHRIDRQTITVHAPAVAAVEPAFGCLRQVRRQRSNATLSEVFRG